MKLKDFLNEATETNIVKVKVRIIDGSKVISGIFTVDVKEIIDPIDAAVAAPNDDVTKYEFTKDALRTIHEMAKKYNVKIDDSGFSDALADGDINGIIELETI